MPALEDDLGVSLFERSRSGVRNTNAAFDFFNMHSRRFNNAPAGEIAGPAGRGAIGQFSIGIR